MSATQTHTEALLHLLAVASLLLPLLSFVISWLIPERHSWAVGLLDTFLMLVASVCAVTLLVRGWRHEPMVIAVSWFQAGNFSFAADLLLSETSMLMLAVVSVISFAVHLYSNAYMAGDPAMRKYFALLGFFTFAMQGIVLSDSLVILFMFWELVGFSSYLLIGHWTERPSAGAAASKAFIMNRIGDAAFVVGLMIIWSHNGTFSITGILGSADGAGWQTAATLCVLGGVIGKSAQFPLLTWLPDAMEGPTPVSALIHAATMVAAGVYLLVRLHSLFTPDALVVVACVGMVTAVVGALAALFQFDLKKVLAYSTISQLGLMTMALGLGIVNAALIHLMAHAFFKACLFLCAGSVIHVLHHASLRSTRHFDVQDIRNMGGLRKKLPNTFLAFSLGSASLAGLPFFSGFLSKEAILASMWMQTGVISWLMLVTMAGVSFITVLYIFRLIWFVFMGEARHDRAPFVVKAPMIMRLPSLFLGFCSLWFMVSWNPFNFMGWLLPEDVAYTHLSWITLFSVLWVAMSIAMGFFLFGKPRFEKNAFLENGFYLDRLYQRSFGPAVLKSADTARYLDKRWIDGLLHGSAYVNVTLAHVAGWVDRALIDGVVNATAGLASWVGSFARSFQGGKIQLYIFWAILTIIIFLIWTLN